jgi:uncharacterized protein YoxC
MSPSMIADVAPDHATFWWITLGLGAVVIAVVIVLLSLLVALVRDIDRNVKEAWQTATRLARNTATTWMLTQAGQISDDLRDEVNQHSRLLAAGGRQ